VAPLLGPAALSRPLEVSCSCPNWFRYQAGRGAGEAGWLKAHSFTLSAQRCSRSVGSGPLKLPDSFCAACFLASRPQALPRFQWITLATGLGGLLRTVEVGT